MIQTGLEPNLENSEIIDIYSSYFECFTKPPTIPLTEQLILDTNRLVNTGLFEIMGLPYSGKTTTLNSLITALEPHPHINFTYNPEFAEEKQRYQSMRDLREFDLDPQCLNHQYSMLKIISTFKATTYQLSQLNEHIKSKRTTKYPIMAIERGNCDAIASEWFGHVASGSKQEIPNWMLQMDTPTHFDWSRYMYPDISKQTDLLLYAFTETILLDALVIFYIDHTHVRKRRLNQNLPPEGYFTSSKTWPYFEQSYAWFLQYIYPLMRKHFGTKLLVINGANKQEDNLMKIQYFISEVYGN